jgi:hypothetical protein
MSMPDGCEFVRVMKWRGNKDCVHSGNDCPRMEMKDEFSVEHALLPRHQV